MISIIVVTILTFFVIYAPQPLLPLLAQTYDISRAEAGLLITVSLLPLSIAPISYGYLLEAMPAVRLLRLSVLGLALTTLAFGLTTPFSWLLGLRFVQGLLLPAILTSLMTYLSASTAPDQLRRVMSIYIAATIAGGYFGRLLSGLSATLLDWRAFFLMLSVGLLISVVALGRLPVTGGQIHAARLTPNLMLRLLQNGAIAKIYAIIFCMFFVFAAFMNFLPFRLVELWTAPSELMTGLMYTGYLVGLATSLGSSRVISRLGSDRLAMVAGILLFMAALLLTLFAGGWGLFGLLFLFCGAMFLVHATAAGLLNQVAAANKGIANGMYIAAYYAGGVIGSYAPGLIYEQFGWSTFVTLLLAMAAVALAIAWGYNATAAGARLSTADKLAR